MSIRHIYAIDGSPITEALYIHNGHHCCARMLGHLHVQTVEQRLAYNRARTARLA